MELMIELCRLINAKNLLQIKREILFAALQILLLLYQLSRKNFRKNNIAKLLPLFLFEASISSSSAEQSDRTEEYLL